MLGGSYSFDDPGVHMDTSDFLQNNNHPPQSRMEHVKVEPEEKEIETSRSDYQHSYITTFFK